MFIEVTEHIFRDRFASMRPDQFSYAGLTALYQYLCEREQDDGEESELDVIAICCEFSEYEMEVVVEEFGLEGFDGDIDDLCDVLSDDHDAMAFKVDDSTLIVSV